MYEYPAVHMLVGRCFFQIWHFSLARDYHTIQHRVKDCCLCTKITGLNADCLVFVLTFIRCLEGTMFKCFDAIGTTYSPLFLPRTICSKVLSGTPAASKLLFKLILYINHSLPTFLFLLCSWLYKRTFVIWSSLILMTWPKAIQGKGLINEIVAGI